MPKVTQEHAEARRGQILEAAFRCFSRKGFHGTTMREICHEADLSAGAIYSYFEGKDEIISALAQTGRQNVRGWREQTASLDPTPEALFSIWQKTFALSHSGGRDSVRLDLRISAESLDNEQIRALAVSGMATVSASFAETVERAQAAGQIDPGLDASAVGDVLLSLYNGLSVHSLLDPDVDVDAAQAVIEALLTGGFVSGSNR